MKCTYLSALFILIGINAFSQDIITLKNGEDIKAKIIEVNPKEIKYKLFNNSSSDTYIRSKADIFRIVFEGGRFEVFTELAELESLHDTTAFNKGATDAVEFYKGNKGYKAAGTTSLITNTLGMFSFGPIFSIISSLTPPKDQNLLYPNKELFKNVAYKNGYKDKAWKIKAGKVWLNAIIPYAVIFGTYYIVNKGKF